MLICKYRARSSHRSSLPPPPTPPTFFSSVPLHSPLLRSLEVLEKNFVFKGKRKVKRAKLYYLSDRNPLRKSMRVYSMTTSLVFARLNYNIIIVLNFPPTLIQQ